MIIALDDKNYPAAPVGVEREWTMTAAGEPVAANLEGAPALGRPTEDFQPEKIAALTWKPTPTERITAKTKDTIMASFSAVGRAMHKAITHLERWRKGDQVSG